MEKAIKRYWPVFVVPTLAAFLIGFVWPFLQGLYLSFCKFITVRKIKNRLPMKLQKQSRKLRL